MLYRLAFLLYLQPHEQTSAFKKTNFLGEHNADIKTTRKNRIRASVSHQQSFNCWVPLSLSAVLLLARWSGYWGIVLKCRGLVEAWRRGVASDVVCGKSGMSLCLPECVHSLTSKISRRRHSIFNRFLTPLDQLSFRYCLATGQINHRYDA